MGGGGLCWTIKGVKYLKNGGFRGLIPRRARAPLESVPSSQWDSKACGEVPLFTQEPSGIPPANGKGSYVRYPLRGLPRGFIRTKLVFSIVFILFICPSLQTLKSNNAITRGLEHCLLTVVRLSIRNEYRVHKFQQSIPCHYPMAFDCPSLPTTLLVHPPLRRAWINPRTFLATFFRINFQRCVPQAYS
jgi:hypothetical protein